MSSIKKIHAREILDSRGNPTVEAEVTLSSGETGRTSVPSGASTGTREALELRDNDSTRYLGKGVNKAVEHINTKIHKLLIGKSALEQRNIDNLMIEADGTENKGNFGANAILAVSVACAKAAALHKKLKLYEYIADISGSSKNYIMPVPMMNILNGGAHADNNIDIQEFMILPVGAQSFKEALRMGAEIFHHLKTLLKKHNLSSSVGDEGGFAPNLGSNAQALDFIANAVDSAGYKLGKDIALALDCAASEFYSENKYHLKSENKSFSSEEFTVYLQELTKNYPIISIEDGMDESDWEGWKLLTDNISDKIQLVGDDIFVTNPNIFSKGIDKQIANSILIKLNQIGTLSETLDTINMARKANYSAVVSHRSGETEDVTIAHLAVGTSSGQIKTGSLCRSDRVAKYNELLRIEENLGQKATFNGWKEF